VECWEQSEKFGFGYAPTRFKLAMAYLNGIHGPADSKKALSYLQLAAAQGHGEASAYLALFHLSGLHLPQSASEAYKLLQTREKAGCAAAIFWLSTLHSGIKKALELAGLAKFLPKIASLSSDKVTALLNPTKIKFAQSDMKALEMLIKSGQLNYHLGDRSGLLLLPHIACA
jgi:TPR repeat protein